MPDADANPFYQEVKKLSGPALEVSDIAWLNLPCATGTRGGEDIDIPANLRWLDNAKPTVEQATFRNYQRYLDDRAAFDFSQAKFCIVCMVTVLQQVCGVRYNPKWTHITPDKPIPDDFGCDSRDVFIHAIIDAIGGTCGSLPVLYVAVGRRLGYPLKIVKAARHLFVRWDGLKGEGPPRFRPEQFNIEATGPGVHFLPDEHYKTWPHKISDEDVAAGIFLKSLTREEELAEFFAARSYCLRRNGRLIDAAEALAEAAKLAPGNRYFWLSHESLRMHIAMRGRGPFLNAPHPGEDSLPDGPFWMTEPAGNKMLVQVCKTGYHPWQTVQVDGHPLSRQTVQTPSGQMVEVHVPVHNAGREMTAHWLRLYDGRFALVHKQERNPPMHDRRCSRCGRRATSNKIGQPILPTPLGARPHRTGMNFAPPADLAAHERSNLLQHLQQIAMKKQNTLPGPSAADLMVMPGGPGVPHLSNVASHRLTLS